MLQYLSFCRQHAEGGHVRFQLVGEDAAVAAATWEDAAVAAATWGVSAADDPLAHAPALEWRPPSLRYPWCGERGVRAGRSSQKRERRGRAR